MQVRAHVLEQRLGVRRVRIWVPAEVQEHLAVRVVVGFAHLWRPIEIQAKGLRTVRTVK